MTTTQYIAVFDGGPFDGLKRLVNEPRHNIALNIAGLDEPVWYRRVGDPMEAVTVGANGAPPCSVLYRVD